MALLLAILALLSADVCLCRTLNATPIDASDPNESSASAAAADAAGAAVPGATPDSAAPSSEFPPLRGAAPSETPAGIPRGRDAAVNVSDLLGAEMDRVRSSATCAYWTGVAVPVTDRRTVAYDGVSNEFFDRAVAVEEWCPQITAQSQSGDKTGGEYKAIAFWGADEQTVIIAALWQMSGTRFVASAKQAEAALEEAAKQCALRLTLAVMDLWPKCLGDQVVSPPNSPLAFVFAMTEAVGRSVVLSAAATGNFAGAGVGGPPVVNKTLALAGG